MASCTVCTHPERDVIERALASGTVSIRGVAARVDVGREALRRHVRGHLSPAMRDAISIVPGLAPVSLARGLYDSLTAISDAMEDAEEKGEIALVYRGAEARARVSAVLADRLGIEKPDALADIHAAESIAGAMALLAERDSDAALALADTFDELQRHDIADDIRDRIQRAAELRGITA